MTVLSDAIPDGSLGQSPIDVTITCETSFEYGDLLYQSEGKVILGSVVWNDSPVDYQTYIKGDVP